MATYKLSPILSVRIKYSQLRNGTYYYYRKIPLAHAGGAGRFARKCLSTSDPIVAARLIAQINKDMETQWHGDHTNTIPVAHNESDLGNFLEKAIEPPRTLRSCREDVTPAESPERCLAAPERPSGTPPEFLLSVAVEFYLERHKKRNVTDFVEDTRRNWDSFLSIVGDKPFSETNRDDAHKFINTRLANGLKTGSIRRQLATLTAVFSKVIAERELTRGNPFSKIQIAGDGEDAEEGIPFTPADLKKTQDACKEMDDSIRWLAALQSDLGCRIAEVAGLALDDLVLDEAIPYVSIKVHPWRSLKKGKENERNIPLVGLSLWAAQRIKSTAANGQTMAFPRYCSVDGCKATSASGAVNKWLRSKLLGLAQENHTSHDFRHAMADRLREVQCPEDIRKKIGGWKVYGLSEVYGKGYSLKVMLEWLQKVELKHPHP